MKKGCLIGCGVLVLGLLIASPWLFQVAMAAKDVKNSGLIDDVDTEKYQASRDNNLLAIHQALERARESDGKYPAAKDWMDQALIRLKTSDLTIEEAKEKLHRPGTPAGKFGYAINKSLAGLDLSAVRLKQSTVIVYESKSDAWNAAGDPAMDAVPSGKGVTLDGKIVGL